MEEDDSVAFVPQPFAPSADPFVSQANAEPRVADELDSLESAVSHESVAPEGSANDRDYDRLAAVMASLGAESEPAEPVATPFVADAAVDETMSIAPVDQEPTLTAFVDELTGDATTSPAVGSEFHEHVDESLSPEIQRKADEIMRSLSVSVESESDPVSHETPVSLQETDTSLQSGQLEPAEDAELTESQQILNEILEQKQLLASQLSSDAVDATSHPQDLAPEVQPAQDDVGASTGDSAGSLPLENVSDVVPVDPVLPMTASEPPVSTGKASRMDYEALFKQLRNTDDET
jgi:hypothetical protein